MNPLPSIPNPKKVGFTQLIEKGTHFDCQASKNHRFINYSGNFFVHDRHSQKQQCE